VCSTSATWRLVVEAGRTWAPGMPKVTCRNGIPRTSRTAMTAPPITTGRRMTVVATRRQNLLSPAGAGAGPGERRKRRRRVRASLVPKVASRAGNRIRLASLPWFPWPPRDALLDELVQRAADLHPSGGAKFG
jgi:hypothetical protein